MRDTSTVYHRDMLADADAMHFSKPWLFETDGELHQCDTEEQACAMQRRYREDHGFDPITGEASAPPTHAPAAVDTRAEGA